MTEIDPRLLLSAGVSILAHFAIMSALDELPRHELEPPPRKIEVRVIEPEPPPEPEKSPEPKPPEPTKQPVHDAPHPHPVHAAVAAAPKDAPPPDHPAVQVETTDEPVYGTTMESTSQGGTTPVPTGNTLAPAAGPGSGAPKPLAEPVAAFEATKMPLPQGRCYGKYTEEAKAAGIEGTVVLDVIVGEDGRVRDVVVAEGLSHGLSEAAVRTLRECRFTPGEKDGKPVPVRIRGYKIRFVLQEAH